MPPIRKSKRVEKQKADDNEITEGRGERPRRPPMPNKRSLEAFTAAQTPVRRARSQKRSKSRAKSPPAQDKAPKALVEDIVPVIAPPPSSPPELQIASSIATLDGTPLAKRPKRPNISSFNEKDRTSTEQRVRFFIKVVVDEVADREGSDLMIPADINDPFEFSFDEFDLQVRKLYLTEFEEHRSLYGVNKCSVGKWVVSYLDPSLTPLCLYIF